jgi:putative hydrolase of the HAD superfamily
LEHIRALTFDLDDTLWDNRDVLVAAEQAAHHWLHRHYPRIAARYSIEDMRNLRLELLQRNPGFCHDISALRRAALAMVAREAGYDYELVEPAFQVFLEARHRVELYGDVVPALRRLRRAGYFLGSITNGNADVSRVGIGHLFDFSLSAENCGRAKPHPRMFEEACRLTRVDPPELAHVGDEPATDLAGAHNAGVTVIWMNRLQQPADPDIHPHAEVRNMGELLELLGIE